MVKRKLSKQIIENEPYQIWNSFIDILAMESADDLSEVQKVAQSSWWYDSEIQNGGHLQYFENTELQDYSSIIDSLKAIGAKDFAALLSEASEMYLGKNRKPIKNVFQFVKKAREGEYDKIDSQYYEISPDMNYYLENYLEAHQDDFIEIE